MLGSGKNLTHQAVPFDSIGCAFPVGLSAHLEGNGIKPYVSPAPVSVIAAQLKTDATMKRFGDVSVQDAFRDESDKGSRVDPPREFFFGAAAPSEWPREAMQNCFATQFHLGHSGFCTLPKAVGLSP